ncbi:MAG: class I SAM-dependent methyltransferase family protein, partial [bacterium]
KLNGKPVSATCRDLDERWLEEGRRKALQYDLKNIVFEKGDALDPKSFANLPFSPDIVVSSGFYDWIVDDTKIKTSMETIHALLKREGFFLFTNQCGHVDMEMVSEIFTDFNSNPLKMTTRSPEKMNSWAEKIGFRVLKTKTDQWGYYSVTLAVKE